MTDAEHAAVLRRFVDKGIPTVSVDAVAAAIERAIELLEREDDLQKLAAFANKAFKR